MRQLVRLEGIDAKTALRFGAGIAQTHLRHPRPLRQIDFHQVGECRHHCLCTVADTGHRARLLHATRLLVVRRLGRDVIEAEYAAIQYIHHDRAEIVLLVIDGNSQDRAGVQNAPDGADDVAEVGCGGTGPHEIAVCDRVESEEPIARPVCGGESRGDGGAEAAQRALIPAGGCRIFKEPRYIVIHVENRFAHGEEPGDVIPNSGHALLCDMEMAIAARCQCFFVGRVLLLIRNKHVDTTGGNLVGGQCLERLVAECSGTAITGNRDDPVVRCGAGGLPCASS